MTDTTKKTRQRKPRGPFSDELIDQLLAQVRGHDAESLLGASLAASEYRTPFAAFAAMSFIAGAIGFVALVVGCAFLVTETRLALQSMYEETQLARGMASGQIKP